MFKKIIYGILISFLVFILFVFFAPDDKLEFKIEGTNQEVNLKNIKSNLIQVLGLSSPAVSIVKNSKILEGYGVDLTVEQWLSSAIGVRGSLRWHVFTSNSYGKDVRVVDAYLERDPNGSEETARIQWLVNVNTNVVELNAVELNNKGVSLLSGLVKIERWSRKDSEFNKVNEATEALDEALDGLLRLFGP